MISDEATKTEAKGGAGAPWRALFGHRARPGSGGAPAKARRRSPALGAVAFYVAWAVNPALFGGCRAFSGFGFGEAEMVQLLGAANQAGPYRFTSASGQAFEVSLALRQVQGDDKLSAAPGAAPSLVSPAHACGDRTFLRSASACESTTYLPVEGDVTVRALANGALVVDHAPVAGKLSVLGTHLTNGSLELQAGGHGFFLESKGDRTFRLSHAKIEGAGEGGRAVEYVAD
ncbi:MAG TPA: hypothetical protein VFS43_23560 [Polyangiaceae bacterium]|nr:hypothetical protein [Polyangiaceae bacterium]